MISKNWTDKEIEKFCEDEFIEEELAAKIHKFLKGEHASIDVLDQGGNNTNLVIELPLREG